MAKVKTPKKEKIVDLKPKAEKITDEQLQKVQSLVNTINRAQLEIGMLESRKHGMLHEVQMIQDQLSILQREFEQEYGTFDINIQDGKINYKEDVKADKKD
jgi:FtsZ-binding cell division protein ZapB